MHKRSSVTMSLVSTPTDLLIGWCCTRRHSRRRRGCTVRLGNKRRATAFRSRPIVRLRFVVGPLKKFKKLLMRLTLDGQLIDSFYLYFSFIYPSLFPFI
ncbi:hypothetical protein AQUCO_07700058v1 [Aquilegia coerulea]|uniref:Uncharacterized protein n=1 Tax=Aquilegia coerulea TaxID=218851 RepID=A0A2G5C8B0_AQUCA|nr:hypothetical protein AQUCO_07700058v1 [Aquilegia coerulea]